MVDLTLHLIDGPFVAFSIDYILYIMRLEPILQLYDHNLKLQIVPNIDAWFQVQTQQRYSQRGFLDMVAAFRAGLEKSYSYNDLRALASYTTIVTKLAVIERLPDFKKHYWIEDLDPVQLESNLAPLVRDQFEQLRVKLGDDGFYNYLCRLWKFAIKYYPSLAPTFERLIGRLDRTPTEPHLPTTAELDQTLLKAVLTIVFERKTTAFKNVPLDIQERLDVINGRRS